MVSISLLLIFNSLFLTRISLQRHLRSLGQRLSTAQKTDLLKQRQCLEARITAFEQHMCVLLNLSEDTQWLAKTGRFHTAKESADELSDADSTHLPEMAMMPELDMLLLPSSLAPREINRNALELIVVVEAELRRGQIHDALHRLQLALGEKSLCFWAEVHNANSQQTSQHAWANVHKYDAEARKHRKMYNHARATLTHLNLFPDFLVTLQDITKADMKMSGDVTEENRYGQHSDTLAWFWRLDDGLSSEDNLNPHMRECAYQFSGLVWC